MNYYFAIFYYDALYFMYHVRDSNVLQVLVTMLICGEFSTPSEGG